MTTTTSSETARQNLTAAESPRLMRAARLHDVGGSMIIEQVERPRATGTDVIVEFSMRDGSQPRERPRELGDVVSARAAPPTPGDLRPRPGRRRQRGRRAGGRPPPGDRVYVNPSRSCGACHACSAGTPQKCDYWTFAGYFGFNQNSLEMFARYPHGGFCEYMKAPQGAIVKLPDDLDFRQATRLGYLGTAFGAVKKLGPLAGKTIIVHGGTGTLGVGVTLIALALGASRVLAVARGNELLERLRALAPERIEVFSNKSGSTAEWARSRTGGMGADFMIDALGELGVGRRIQGGHPGRTSGRPDREHRRNGRRGRPGREVVDG